MSFIACGNAHRLQLLHRRYGRSRNTLPQNKGFFFFGLGGFGRSGTPGPPSPLRFGPEEEKKRRRGSQRGNMSRTCRQLFDVMLLMRHFDCHMRMR